MFATFTKDHDVRLTSTSKLTYHKGRSYDLPKEHFDSAVKAGAIELPKPAAKADGGDSGKGGDPGKGGK